MTATSIQYYDSQQPTRATCIPESRAQHLDIIVEKQRDTFNIEVVILVINVFTLQIINCHATLTNQTSFSYL